MIIRRSLFLLMCLLAVSAAGLLVKPAQCQMVALLPPEQDDHEAQPNQGRKVALLIGVQRYDGTGLRNLDYAENDVNQLARTLKDQGFQEIILLTRSEARRTDRDFLEPTAENVRSYLKNLLARMAKEDTLLVAFSGHGVQFKADGAMYFCPAQTNLAKRESLVSLDEVYTALNEKVPGRKVLLVDACRNDPADGLGANDPDSVTRPQVPDPPGGTVALFSCSKGQRAFESLKHKSGFLFHTIVEGLRGGAADTKTGEVGWLDLAKYVQRTLPAAVTAEKGPGAVQMPEIRGTLRGELILARVKSQNRPIQPGRNVRRDDVGTEPPTFDDPSELLPMSRKR